MCHIIDLLKAALQPYLSTHQPILLMDACRIHYHPRVFHSCYSANIWPVVIPARLTWLLQPCDTHAFLGYKADLKTKYQIGRLNTGTGEFDTAGFLCCLYSTIRTILQGTRWATAFDCDGFGANQAALSTYILRNLELEVGDIVSVCADLPSEEKLKLCLPKKARIAMKSLLGPFLPRRPVAKRLVRPAAMPPPPKAAIDLPPTLSDRGQPPPLMLGRTRAQHKAASASAGPSPRSGP